MVLAIVIWGMSAIVATMVAGVLAGVKNRDYSFWMGWSFVCPPIVLVLAVLPKLDGPRPRRPTLDEEDAAGPM